MSDRRIISLRWRRTRRWSAHSKCVGTAKSRDCRPSMMRASKRPVHRANSAFSDLHAVAAIQAMLKDGTEERVLPAPLQGDLNAIIESVDVPRLLADHLPDLRNQLAHGSQRLSPTSDLVLLDIRDAVEMIFDGTPAIDAPEVETTKQPGVHQLFKVHLAHLETKRP